MDATHFRGTYPAAYWNDASCMHRLQSAPRA